MYQENASYEGTLLAQ